MELYMSSLSFKWLFMGHKYDENQDLAFYLDTEMRSVGTFAIPPASASMSEPG